MSPSGATRIDFAFGAPDRLRTTCAVIRRHYVAGRRLLVYGDDPRVLERFDLLLWSFDRTAFIPHVFAGDPLAARTPVLLTGAPPELPPSSDDGAQAPWLVNLAAQCVPNAGMFERVLEIVSGADEDRLAARERWRQYKSLGYELRAHDLRERAAGGPS